jgi:hypothetical protein
MKRCYYLALCIEPYNMHNHPHATLRADRKGRVVLVVTARTAFEAVCAWRCGACGMRGRKGLHQGPGPATALFQDRKLQMQIYTFALTSGGPQKHPTTADRSDVRAPGGWTSKSWRANLIEHSG